MGRQTRHPPVFDASGRARELTGMNQKVNTLHEAAEKGSGRRKGIGSLFSEPARLADLFHGRTVGIST
jgi:hypothetical protein